MTTSSPVAISRSPGMACRLCPVRTGGDDRRERLVLGAQAVVLGAQVPGDVCLGAPHEAAADDRRNASSVTRGGTAHRCQLRVVFDGAQEGHAVADVAQPARMAAAQDPVAGVAQMRPLITEDGAEAHVGHAPQCRR